MRLALRIGLTIVTVVVSMTMSGNAVAQDEPDQRQAAAAAYDRGTAAYLRDDYARAARWFETAHRLAPAAPALIQAVRAHHKADDLARALTLSLRLQAEYANDDRAVALADELLSAHASAFVRVRVNCDGCQVDLDGKLQEAKEFFLEPDTEHEVTAIFPTGPVTKQVGGSSSQEIVLELEAPPAPVGERSPTTQGEPSGLAPGPVHGSANAKLPPLAVYIGAGVTGALLAGMVISGLDANAKGGRYDRAISDFNGADCALEVPPDPSLCRDLRERATARFDPADSAETRTNVLLAATLVAAAGTGVLAAFFTDWQEPDAATQRAALRVGVASLGDGAYATLGGAF